MEKRVLCLDLDRRQGKFLVAVRQKLELTVARCGAVAWSEAPGRITPDSRAGAELRRWLVAEGLGSVQWDRVMVAIPSRSAFFRFLDVPASQPRELEAMLAVRLEVEVPFAPQDAAWSFCTMPPGESGEPASGRARCQSSSAR